MSNIPAQVSIAMFTLENEDIYYKVKWTHLSLQMWIFENKDTWYGTMTPEDFQGLSTESMDPVEEYFNNFYSAVAKKDSGYELDIRRINDDNIEFVVKKRHEHAVNTYGFIKLHKDLVSSKNNLIEYMMHKFKEFIDESEEMEEKNRRLTNELSYAKSLWLEEAKTKNQMEKEVYAKFVDLINTKKQYIQALENLNKNQNNS